MSRRTELARFEGTSAHRHLEWWASERGWHLGPPQGVSPQGLSATGFVAKWRSLTERERRELVAVAEWDPRGGSVVVWGQQQVRAPEQVEQMALFGARRS